MKGACECSFGLFCLSLVWHFNIWNLTSPTKGSSVLPSPTQPLSSFRVLKNWRMKIGTVVGRVCNEHVL